MRPPRWVVDTNVFVSAAITPGGVCDQLLQCAVAGLFVPAWDNTLLLEYREVLHRPKFRLSKASVRALLSALPQSGFHPGAAMKLELPDPDDLPFVAVAVACGDQTVVTGNPDHFPAACLRKVGVKILAPRQALDLLADF
jgi:putative PIN family toxin of toxin-antitoxin system